MGYLAFGDLVALIQTIMDILYHRQLLVRVIQHKQTAVRVTPTTVVVAVAAVVVELILDIGASQEQAEHTHI